MSDPADRTPRVARRMSRRAFLKGTAVGAAGMWAAAVLPRRVLGADPNRPPALYEFYVDSYWMDAARAYEAPIHPPLRGRQRADVVILGGGFTGMSTAYHLARRFPERRIVLLEGARCGYGASGRNGGFADPGQSGLGWVDSTLGPEAARAYYDATLLGLAQIRAFVSEHGVDCDFEANGSLELATDERQLAELAAQQQRLAAMGLPAMLLDRAELRRAVGSERFVGALRLADHAILNPAKLALGMRRTIASLGVEISERSKVLRIEPGKPVRVTTEYAEVEAPRAVIALNGYAPQIGLFRDRVLPLCNYVCATEPLSAAQREAIGWRGREGLSDARVEFMYLRLTADDRIVFGGESSPYFYDSSPSTGVYRPSVEKLQRSLLTTFPQLEGIRFTHTWGGTMAFTRDFVPSVGRLGDSDDVFYAFACNGEGVVMTQLAGKILCDLVSGEQTALTRLPIVGKPMPWLGPEPLRSAAVRITERLLTWWGDSPMR